MTAANHRGPVAMRVHAERGRPDAGDEFAVIHLRRGANFVDVTDRPGPQFVPDGELAASMATLADTFVSMLAEGITGLDYSDRSVGLLDGLCRGFLSGEPDAVGVRGFAVLLGAYLGETLVREGCGVWATAETTTSLADQQENVAILLPSGLAAFPLTKVNKRLTVGAEHDLEQFFEVCRAGQLPPGSKPMTT